MNKVLFILSGLFICSVACLDAQVIRNAGKLHIGGNPSTTTALYIDGGIRMTGSGDIAHEGKTVLIGDFINDVTANTVFSTRNGTFEFRGRDAQKIHGSANKTTNYITFPNRVIVNNQHSDYRNTTVTVDYAMGITVRDLTFTRGRMVLDSRSSTLGGQRITDIAHLNAEQGGAIAYKHNQTNATDEGIVQVNLSLGDNWNQNPGRIVGFSSPFKKLYADYFLFNFLAEPDTIPGFGSRSGDLWIKDPKTELPAGRGYFMGQGLVPWNDSYYQETLSPAYYSAQRNDAVKDTFVFARRFAPASLSSFVNAAYGANAYIGEELNTSDVSVSIAKGLNFLGNPFLAPIKVSDLFASTIPSGWGITAADIEPRAWTLSTGYAGYLPDRTFYFGFNYLVAQQVGATAGDTIAPMQMFVISKTSNGNANFIIPQSKRIHANAHFLRSETAPEPVVDELLIETRDGLTGDFDRLCIVFRYDASLAATDRYDAPKLFNRTGGVNQAYTRSSDNKSLTTNVIPPSEDKLVMYFEPSRQPQEVTLRASRLNSITAVPNVVMEDRQTGFIADLKQMPVYRFQSSPSDRTDRFVLYFGLNAPTGLDRVNPQAFHVNYESDGIGIYGIDDRWMGHSVLVYDMLGQLVARHTITQAPFMRIEESLSRGIYLLKIAGVNTAASKFLVK
ncbi:MAG: T9SS type A sorting domain-containing protein [Tannerellaceae bacterium]|jgi:hypothetical protein|nr:T9SS type A sorting domain-containing protein [Tannerellaceae bacterium]